MINMSNNRYWLAFANRKRCKHADAIHNLGFISNKICKMYVIPRSNLSILNERQEL